MSGRELLTQLRQSFCQALVNVLLGEFMAAPVQALIACRCQ